MFRTSTSQEIVMTCHCCGGSGRVLDRYAVSEAKVRCLRCEGSGELFDPFPTSTYTITPDGDNVPCPDCDGAGEVESAYAEPASVRCPECFGGGRVWFEMDASWIGVKRFGKGDYLVFSPKMSLAGEKKPFTAKELARAARWLADVNAWRGGWQSSPTIKTPPPSLDWDAFANWEGAFTDTPVIVGLSLHLPIILDIRSIPTQYDFCHPEPEPQSDYDERFASYPF